MAEYTKQYYSISEVSRMLEVTAPTLNWWEKEIPMFNPNRSPKGTRRFTPADIDMAKYIKELLYEKGLKIDAAVAYINKNYRKSTPRRPRKCKTAEDAITLLGEVKDILEDAHAIGKVSAVQKWIVERENSAKI